MSKKYDKRYITKGLTLEDVEITRVVCYDDGYVEIYYDGQNGSGVLLHPNLLNGVQPLVGEIWELLFFRSGQLIRATRVRDYRQLDSLEV